MWGNSSVFCLHTSSGHRIPRGGCPADRGVSEHSGLPVPAAKVQRRPPEDHPARPHVHERGRRIPPRHQDVAVQLQVQPHVRPPPLI